MTAPRRRWATVMVVLLAVVATTVAAVAIHGKTGAAERNPVTQALVESQTLPKIGATAHPAVLYIGDGYTMGPYALTDLGYACLTATNMGWQCNVNSEPASGYIAGGEGQRLPPVLGLFDSTSTSINERFAHLRELYNADVVVLDGGRNDVRFGPTYLRNMMEFTISRAKEAWPKARIVVILPWLMRTPVLMMPDSDTETLDGYLEGQMRANPNFQNVTFIDPAALGWFANEDVTGLLDTEGIYPNYAAHRRIAEYLTNALRQNGLSGPL